MHTWSIDRHNEPVIRIIPTSNRLLIAHRRRNYHSRLDPISRLLKGERQVRGKISISRDGAFADDNVDALADAFSGDSAARPTLIPPKRSSRTFATRVLNFSCRDRSNAIYTFHRSFRTLIEAKLCVLRADARWRFPSISYGISLE